MPYESKATICQAIQLQFNAWMQLHAATEGEGAE